MGGFILLSKIKPTGEHKEEFEKNYPIILDKALKNCQEIPCLRRSLELTKWGKNPEAFFSEFSHEIALTLKYREKPLFVKIPKNKKSSSFGYGDFFVANQYIEAKRVTKIGWVSLNNLKNKYAYGNLNQIFIITDGDESKKLKTPEFLLDLKKLEEESKLKFDIVDHELIFPENDVEYVSEEYLKITGSCEKIKPSGLSSEKLTLKLKKNVKKKISEMVIFLNKNKTKILFKIFQKTKKFFFLCIKNFFDSFF